MTNPGEDPPVRLKPGKVSVGCQTQQELLAATKDFGSNEPTTSQNNGNKNAQPVTPSTGTTQTEDGLLRLSVADFHHLEDTMCSPSKIINGVPWRIMIMPKQHTTGKKTQKCLAFFLQCCPANTYNDKWTCQAIAEMRLLAQKRGNQNFVRKTTHIYNSKENDWGYSCFMTWAEIIDESQGYIKNGSVIVEIVVRAEAPKNMMTKDDFLFKLKQWYRLAENHMNNDRVDLAIEANQQAVDYCKNKDPEMAKQLKTQKDALVAQKLVESIKRLEDGSSPKKQPQTEGRAAIRSAIAGPMCNNEFCRLHKAKRQCTHLKKTSKPTSAQRNSARTPRAPCSSPRPPGSTIRPTCKSHQEANHTEGACSGSKIAKRADLPIGTGSNQSRGEAKVDDEDLGAESEGSYTDMGQAVDLAEICQVQIATAESSCQTEDITMDREEEGDEDDVEWCHQNSSENNSTEETTSTQDEESNDEGIPEEALTKENGYKRDKRPTTPELLFFHKRPILQAARKNPKGMTEVSPVLLDDHHVSCLLDAFKALQQPKEKNINGQKTNGSTEKTLKKNQHLKWLCDDVDTMVTMISFFKKDFKLYQERHEAQLENTSPMEQHENMAMFFAIGMANYQCDRMTQEVERFLEKSEQLFHGKRMGTLIGRLSGGKLALDDEASVDKSSMDVEFNSDDSRSTTTALSETDASESASLEMCSEEEEEIEIEEGEELHANVSGDRAYNSDLRDVAENLMTFNQSMYTAIGRFKSFGDALSQVSQQVESTVPEKISTCDHGDLQRRLELRTKSLQNEQAAHQLTKKKLEELKAQSSESKSKVEQLNKQLREKTNDNKRLEKKSLKDDAKINELFTDKTEQDEKLKNQKRDTNSLKMKHSDELKTLKLERDQLQVELDKLKKEASMRESQVAKEKSSIEAKLRQANATIRDLKSVDVKEKRALADANKQANSALENASLRIQESDINAMVTRFEATITLREYMLSDAQREVSELEIYANNLRAHSAREQEFSSKLESSIIEWKTFVDTLNSTLTELRNEASGKMEMVNAGSLDPSKAELTFRKVERPTVFRPLFSSPGVIGEQRNKALGSPGSVSPSSQSIKKQIGAIGERPTATVAPQTVSGVADSSSNCTPNIDEHPNGSSSSIDVDMWNPLEILARGPMNIPPVRWNGYPRISWLMPGATMQPPVMQDIPNMEGYLTQLPPHQSSPMLPPIGYPLPRYPTRKEEEDFA